MAPECPADRAKVVAYEGHADLNPPECFGCSCKAPTGSCEVSSVVKGYTGLACSGDELDFTAPDPWDGQCVFTDPPLEGAVSLFAEPLTMTESGCEPEQHDVPLDGAPKWGTFARACLGNGFTMPCPDPSDYCAPTSEPPPEGFSQCVYQDGDHACPPDYPSKHVFFAGVTDLRTCTACSCGAAEGGSCSAGLTVSSEVTCPFDDLGFYFSLISMAPQCLNLPVGMALGAKRVDSVWYTPGSCEPSGGEPVGSVELVGPSTFCCQE
jgi:hypothetical protein